MRKGREKLKPCGNPLCRAQVAAGNKYCWTCHQAGWITEAPRKLKAEDIKLLSLSELVKPKVERGQP